MNFNIAIVLDDAYAHHAWAMLSRLKKNVSQPLTVHCVHTQLSDKNLAIISQLANTDFAISLQQITAAGFDRFIANVSQQERIYAHEIVNMRLSQATYIKLFLPAILPLDITRVLYLDCDVEVRSIDAFVDLDISNVYAAACKDTISRKPEFADHISALGIKNYLNSGVLYMNLDRLRDLLVERTLQECIISLDGVRKFRDQDFWNTLIADQCHFLPMTNNLIHSHVSPAPRARLKTAAIVHYTGRAKRYPLHWYLTLLTSAYRMAMLKQCLINVAHQGGQTHKILKRYSKLLRHILYTHLFTDEEGRSRYENLRQNRSLRGRLRLYRFICWQLLKKH